MKFEKKKREKGKQPPPGRCGSPGQSKACAPSSGEGRECSGPPLLLGQGLTVHTGEGVSAPPA